jgi:hypothetical protein
LLALTACAFTNIPLTLPTRGLSAPIPGGKARQVVVVVPFADQRTIQNRCGMQKNGYNMDTADAICQSDPSTWLAELLARELKASGFEVVGADAPHKPGALRVEGTLTKLFVEPVIGAFSGSLEADLFVTLRASSETGLVAERGFAVKGWQGGRVVSTSSAFNESLDRATQGVVEEMVRAIIELMGRYPQLGARETEVHYVGDLGEK